MRTEIEGGKNNNEPHNKEKSRRECVFVCVFVCVVGREKSSRRWMTI
jgi:hypothetical protein